MSRHRLIVEKILAKLDFLDETIEDLSAEIDRLIMCFPRFFGGFRTRFDHA